MIEVTQLQRDNAISAKEMWLTVPEANVVPRLATWNYYHDAKIKRPKAPTCKTIACFGGWCAWWPAFQAQGIKADPVGMPVIHENEDQSVCFTLFGVYRLFISRGRAEADESFKSRSKQEYEEASDWKIIMNRIDYLIQNTVVTL